MGKNERSNLAPKVREETETERVGGWSVDLVPQVFQERCSGACGDAIHLHVGDVGNHGSSVTAQPLGVCVCQTQKTAMEIKATAIEELVLPYASTVSIRSWAKVESTLIPPNRFPGPPLPSSALPDVSPCSFFRSPP